MHLIALPLYRQLSQEDRGNLLKRAHEERERREVCIDMYILVQFVSCILSIINYCASLT